MRGKTGDAVRLRHILYAIQEIESYLFETDFNSFMETSMMRFACIKQLEIIGEVSNHISEETKQEFSGIEWIQLRGMRNVLVHEYFGVDAKLVWQIIKTDIPALKIKGSEIVSRIG